jgi:hypothetical protein
MLFFDGLNFVNLLLNLAQQFLVLLIIEESDKAVFAVLLPGCIMQCPCLVSVILACTFASQGLIC